MLQEAKAKVKANILAKYVSFGLTRFPPKVHKILHK